MRTLGNSKDFGDVSYASRNDHLIFRQSCPTLCPSLSELRLPLTSRGQVVRDSVPYDLHQKSNLTLPYETEMFHIFVPYDAIRRGYGPYPLLPLSSGTVGRCSRFLSTDDSYLGTFFLLTSLVSCDTSVHGKWDRPILLMDDVLFILT